MDLLYYLSGEVGSDVANIILDYKAQLDFHDKYKKVLHQLTQMIRIQIIYEGEHLTPNGYYLELEVFLNLISSLGLRSPNLNIYTSRNWAFSIKRGTIYLVEYKRYRVGIRPVFRTYSETVRADPPLEFANLRRLFRCTR